MHLLCASPPPPSSRSVLQLSQMCSSSQDRFQLPVVTGCFDKCCIKGLHWEVRDRIHCGIILILNQCKCMNVCAPIQAGGIKDGVTWRIPSACMYVWMWLCVWMCVPRYNPVKDGMTWRIPVASRVPWITIIHPFSLSIIHYNPKQYNNSSFLIINRMRIRYMVYGK